MTGSAPRVSMIVHALDANPIVRAAPIAHALQRIGFEVDVAGVLKPGTPIYAPYADEFDYTIAASIRSLSQQIRGDIIYACKPVPQTLLSAMLASGFGRSKPVLLDVEDDDFGVVGRNRLIRCGKAVRDATLRQGGYLNPIANACRRYCDVVTVSTTALRNFYGGTTLLHGPNEHVFDPDREDLDPGRCRKMFSLPQHEQLVLFAGRPFRHKGIHEIIDAAEKVGCGLVLAGDSKHELYRLAKAKLRDKCHLVGLVPNRRMPHLLAAVDVVPVPQHDVPFANTQMPAKLIEAMAMKKAVIASAVGDLPAVVSGAPEDARGWVIRPGCAEQLAAAISDVQCRPDVAGQRAERAREFFQSHASISANSKVLRQALEGSERLRKFLPAPQNSPPSALDRHPPRIQVVT